MITLICELFRPEEAIFFRFLAGFGECYTTKSSRPVAVPLLSLKEFCSAPEADTMSSVLQLHKKPAYRFSQTRKIICEYRFLSVIIDILIVTYIVFG